MVDIGIAIPSIPTRGWMLQRALNSVRLQTLQPTQIEVSLDDERLGAPYNRDAALAKLDTEYVAFLDDDDELLPTHLEDCYAAMIEHDADLVFPWFDVVGGLHPFPTNFGVVWSNENYIHVPVTFLAKTELIRECGGFSNNGTFDTSRPNYSEELELLWRIMDTDAVIWHLPKVTWLYHHDSGNTSGRADRW